MEVFEEPFSSPAPLNVTTAGEGLNPRAGLVSALGEGGGQGPGGARGSPVPELELGAGSEMMACGSLTPVASWC